MKCQLESTRCRVVVELAPNCGNPLTSTTGMPRSHHCPGVQTNRGGIEIAVFRFKTLAKTVPSDARLLTWVGESTAT